MNAEGSILEKGQPYLFAGIPELAYVNELRKKERGTGVQAGSPTTLTYNRRYGMIENQKDPSTNLFSVDQSGIKQHVESTDGTRSSKQEDIAVVKSSDTGAHKILKASIDNRQTHRYISIICHDEVHIHTACEFYVRHEFKHWTHDEKDGVVEQVTARVKQIVNQTVGTFSEPFIHQSVGYDVIDTADYRIHYCATEHAYTSNNDSYGLKIFKKVILASSKHSKETLNIPVCEELIIQIQTYDTSGIKDVPVLVNSEKSLVISLSLKSTDAANYPSKNLHFFGDNAFTIALHSQGDKIIETQDRNKLCAQMAGSLCKGLLEIHSTDDSKRTKILKKLEQLFYSSVYQNDPHIHKLRLLLLRASAENTRDQPDAELQGLISREERALKISNNPNSTSETVENLSELQEQERKDKSYCAMKSFVIRQNVRSLVKAENGNFCNIKKWTSAQTFSILAMSPQQGKNYVFVLVHGLFGGKPTVNRNVETDMSRSLSAKAVDDILPEFDLERELRSIMADDCHY
jgi:hypothetical protein